MSGLIPEPCRIHRTKGHETRILRPLRILAARCSQFCLNPNSAKGGTFTGEGDGCGKYMQGEPIDSLDKRATA